MNICVITAGRGCHEWKVAARSGNCLVEALPLMPGRWPLPVRPLPARYSMNMRWSIRFFLILALACGAILADGGNEGTSLTVGDRAPDFVLIDADDRQHSLSQLDREGKAVLLIMGNRKTRKEHEKWAEAFREEYGDREWITSYIVLDMRSAPAFAPKALIKKKLTKNRPAATVLLDWKGKVHQVYRTQKETPNLYLIRLGGQLTFRLDANFGPEAYLQLEKAIDHLRPKRATDKLEPVR